MFVDAYLQHLYCVCTPHMHTNEQIHTHIYKTKTAFSYHPGILISAATIGLHPLLRAFCRKSLLNVTVHKYILIYVFLFIF